MSVYYVHAPDLGMVKIGFATDPKARFSKIQSDSPVRLILLGFEVGDEAAEAARHVEFTAYRQRGEWFRLDGTLADHVRSLAPLAPKAVSMNKQLVAIGISPSYASMILNGVRPPSRSLAISIFHKTGRKFGPVADLSDDDIATLARIEGIAA